MRQKINRRHVSRSMVRRALGWSAICIGLVGVVVPILPGFVCIALGIVLLGPHDPALRRVAIGIRLLLRRWSHAKHRRVRHAGQIVRRRYYEQRMVVRAHLHRHEDDEQGWRGHYVLLALTLLGLAISAGIGFYVWHRIL